ncbi:MAG: hypothetical protein U0W40_08105 [Acidimicrobiia bacterium]
MDDVAVVIDDSDVHARCSRGVHPFVGQRNSAHGGGAVEWDVDVHVDTCAEGGVAFALSSS